MNINAKREYPCGCGHTYKDTRFIFCTVCICKEFLLGGNFPNVDLTPKEAECIYWASRWLTNKEIAEKMEIKKRSVATSLEHIREKLSCYSKLHLQSMINEWRK